MTLALPDKWLWDSWYVQDGDLWHAFFLQADKAIGDPDLRHWNVSVGHATSRNLRDWRHLGTCLRPAQGPAWDDYTTWTGSVVRGDDERWHLFYTGSCRAEDGLYQRIGHAVSDDLHRWERVEGGLCLDLIGPESVHYEADHATSVWHDRAMRDPWVMRDPRGGWMMAFTARVPGVAEPNAGGAIGFATSPDLYAWTLQPPVFAGAYGQLEVPQLFEARGRWYGLFCTAAEHFSKTRAEATPGGPVTGNHYLVAADPRGPWTVAEGFLDGALPPVRYAARILETDAGLVIMGFSDRPEGRFVGEILDPAPIRIDEDGRLTVGQLERAE